MECSPVGSRRSESSFKGSDVILENFGLLLYVDKHEISLSIRNHQLSLDSLWFTLHLHCMRVTFRTSVL